MKVKPQAPQLLSYFLAQPGVLCNHRVSSSTASQTFFFLFFTRLFTISLIQQLAKPHNFSTQQSKESKVPLYRHTDKQTQPFSRSSSSLLLPSLLPTFRMNKQNKSFPARVSFSSLHFAPQPIDMAITFSFCLFVDRRSERYWASSIVRTLNLSSRSAQHYIRRVARKNEKSR